MGPEEGNGSCGMCRAEMCRAKMCRATHAFNFMDVRVHDKPGLSPTVFSFYDDASFFLLTIRGEIKIGVVCFIFFPEKNKK